MKQTIAHSLTRLRGHLRRWQSSWLLSLKHTTKQIHATDIAPEYRGTTAPLPALLRARTLAQHLRLPTLKQTTAGTLNGENLSKRGRGLHFEETRMYQAGDDIRHIDWRVTARTGETHTKVFREEHERPVIFLIDLNANMHFGTQGCYKSVLAAHITAVLAFAAIHEGNPIGGLVLHNDIKRSQVQPKERGVLPLLKLISQACASMPSTPIDLAIALKSTQAMLKSGCLLVIISDFFELSSQSEKLLMQIAYQHPLWLLQTRDPVEVSPPAAGYYGVSDGHHFSSFNTAEPKQAQAYLQFCEARQTKIINMAKRLGVLHMPLYTHQAIKSQLIRLTKAMSQS